MDQTEEGTKFQWVRSDNNPTISWEKYYEYLEGQGILRHMPNDLLEMGAITDQLFQDGVTLGMNAEGLIIRLSTPRFARDYITDLDSLHDYGFLDDAGYKEAKRQVHAAKLAQDESRRLLDERETMEQIIAHVFTHPVRRFDESVIKMANPYLIMRLTPDELRACTEEITLALADFERLRPMTDDEFHKEAISIERAYIHRGLKKKPGDDGLKQRLKDLNSVSSHRDLANYMKSWAPYGPQL